MKDQVIYVMIFSFGDILINYNYIVTFMQIEHGYILI
jgi:hypothetical protein